MLTLSFAGGDISGAAPACQNRRLPCGVEIRQSQGIERDLFMRLLILCLVVMTAAFPAYAQKTPLTAAAVLSLGSRAAHAAQPHLDDGVSNMVGDIATNYREGAPKTGDVVNEKALAEVSKSETAAFSPLLWAGMAKIYAETYTVAELNSLLDYYNDHPGDPQFLPATLTAKNGELERRQRDLIGELGPRVLQDFFGDYCSRVTCTDIIRQAAGLPVHAR
jgi:hypothetical protein